MDIWDIDKLFLFIAFVVPGFISIKAYQLFFPGEKHKSSEQIVDAIAYSSINYAILFWAIILVEDSKLRENYPSWYFLFYTFVLLIAPIIWVWLWAIIRKTDFLQNNAPHPTSKAWDFVFAQRKQYWVKVTLKNGEMIGGLFSTKSFASSAPAEEQIYLEEAWILNKEGGFERMKNDSAGVIILSSEISHMEFRKYEQENA